MVIEEKWDETHVRHYSDSNMKIRQVETGALYNDAVDILPCRYTYEESDVPINESPEVDA